MIDIYIVNIQKYIESKGDILPFSREEMIKKTKQISSLLISTYTGVGKIKYNAYGKPLKDGIYFNISHSHDIVCLAISKDVEVGLDVEKIRYDIKDDLDEYVFGEKIQSTEVFFDRWTHLEAAIKCLGFGFDCNFRKISHANGENMYMGKKYIVEKIECISGYSMALAYMSDRFVEYKVHTVM